MGREERNNDVSQRSFTVAASGAKVSQEAGASGSRGELWMFGQVSRPKELGSRGLLDRLCCGPRPSLEGERSPPGRVEGREGGKSEGKREGQREDLEGGDFEFGQKWGGGLRNFIFILSKHAEHVAHSA